MVSTTKITVVAREASEGKETGRVDSNTLDIGVYTDVDYSNRGCSL
jgi:hypothetical protein